MIHGHRIVNVGTLRNGRPKWNQAIRFKNAEFTGNVTFRLHDERGKDLMKRRVEIYPAYDKIMKVNGYEFHKDL